MADTVAALRGADMAAGTVAGSSPISPWSAGGCTCLVQARALAAMPSQLSAELGQAATALPDTG
jgi:hypothetical protein